jgi:hypothetical protein
MDWISIRPLTVQILSSSASIIFSLVDKLKLNFIKSSRVCALLVLFLFKDEKLKVSQSLLHRVVKYLANLVNVLPILLLPYNIWLNDVKDKFLALGLQIVPVQFARI